MLKVKIFLKKEMRVIIFCNDTEAVELRHWGTLLGN